MFCEALTLYGSSRINPRTLHNTEKEAVKKEGCSTRLRVTGQRLTLSCLSIESAANSSKK